MISLNETAKGINRCFSILWDLLYSVLMIAMIQTIESSKRQTERLDVPGYVIVPRSVGLDWSGWVDSSELLVDSVLRYSVCDPELELSTTMSKFSGK